MVKKTTFSVDDYTIGGQRGACVLAGPLETFFDHSVPICSLLDIPLITNAPMLIFKLKRFYPPFDYKLVPNLSLEEIIPHYSNIFYGFGTMPYTYREILNQRLQDKDCPASWKCPTQFIYHLHGCSDKHWFSPQSHLRDADHVLVYGNRMLDIFKNSGFDLEKKSFPLVGNYRLAYYQKNKDFFDVSAQKNIFSKFEKKQPTLLYAPTWHDKNNSSSVLKATSKLLETLPAHLNLLIKLHPLLKMDLPNKGSFNELYQLLLPYLEKPNLQVHSLFPHMHSLLSHVDGYIGDYSSVGYDALAFNIPLFFINHKQRDPLNDPSALLLKSGVNISLKDLNRLYSIVENHLDQEPYEYAAIRQQIYHYAFGKDLSYKEVAQNLKKLCHKY